MSHERTDREGFAPGRKARAAAGSTARRATALAAPLFLLALGACTTSLELKPGAVELSLEAGSGWMHKHALFLGLSMYTPPQIAIWVEDMGGNHIGTLYVTKKSATQGWLASAGEGLKPSEIRRPEALPAWSHRRGIAYPDGLYMPTAAKPLVDAVSAATPKEGFSLALEPAAGLRKFRILAEINQSLDFNTAYPDDAAKGDPGYSGGAFGSGQPSLVYYADIDLDSGTDSYAFALLGHGSADGSDGTIAGDCSGVTDAAGILGRMTAKVAK